MGKAVRRAYEGAWEWHIGSEPAHVRAAVREIQARLDESLPSQTQEERGDLRLILSELLYNAVIHGNGLDAGKRVHVRITVSGPMVRASITDEGAG
jgi:anti-sigma regulatory factor (Ser/Thr protein kinase)